MDNGFIYDDGGAAAEGFKGQARDCVTRAIAIATGKSYLEIYVAIDEIAKTERIGTRKRGISDPRKGVYKQTYKKLLARLGWVWVPTMQIGSGCKVHLDARELPKGRLIVAVSKHLTTMIDGIIHDTFDPRHGGGSYAKTVNGITTYGALSERCVYGYFYKSETAKESSL